MLGSLRQKMSIKGGSVYGIELNLGGRESLYWTLVQLTLSKNKEVKIVRQAYFEEAFSGERLSNLNLKKSIPIALCIAGTGVLISELSEGSSAGSLFPGLDEDEIYGKEYATPSFRYASVIRKDVLLNVTKQLVRHGFFVWDIAIGPLNVLSILPLLQAPKQEVLLGGYKVQLSPVTVEKNEDEIPAIPEGCAIGAEQTTTVMLPSLAAAVNFYVNTEAPSNELLKNQQKEFKAFKKSKLVGYSFLGVLLVMLLINFMLYSKYTRQLEDAQLALRERQRLDKQLSMLKKDLSEKQGILTTMGIQREVPLSYIADRFAACIPDGIKLDRLDINPLADKVRERKPILFIEGKLRAEGICDSPEDLNLLLERLKKEEWLVRVDKKEYRENDLKGRFILEVSYE